MGWSRKRAGAVVASGVQSIWNILFWGVLFGTVVMLYNIVVMPMEYCSQASIYVSDAAADSGNAIPVGSAEGSVVELPDSFANSYLEVITSEKTMKRVRRTLGSSMELEALAGCIDMEQVGSTAVFRVTTKYSDAQSARLLAQATAESAVKTLDSVGVEAYVLDSASLPLTPSSPHVLRNTLGALGIGLILRWLIALIGALRDHTLQGAEDWNEVFDIPVLAEIPERGR